MNHINASSSLHRAPIALCSSPLLSEVAAKFSTAAAAQLATRRQAALAAVAPDKRPGLDLLLPQTSSLETLEGLGGEGTGPLSLSGTPVAPAPSLVRGGGEDEGHPDAVAASGGSVMGRWRPSDASGPAGFGDSDSARTTSTSQGPSKAARVGSTGGRVPSGQGRRVRDLLCAMGGVAAPAPPGTRPPWHLPPLAPARLMSLIALRSLSKRPNPSLTWDR